MRTTNDVSRNHPTYDKQVVTDDSAPRSLGEELQCMMFDGKRRAQVRARLNRLLDQQLAALRATDTDIERVEEEAQKLIVVTEVLLAHPAALHSLRDPGQYHTVQKKLADLKAELATRAESKRALIDEHDA